MKKKSKPQSPKLSPQDVLNQAQHLAQTQRLDQAEKLLGLYPDHPDCLFRRASVLAVMERWDLAEGCYRKVLAMAPGHFDSAMGLSGSLIEQDRGLEALPMLESMVRFRPGFQTRYARGVALSQAGMAKESDQDLAFCRSRITQPFRERDWLPTELYLQISRRCNLRCAMCGHEVWKNNSGFMEQDVFDRALDQAKKAGIQQVHILAGQGEPMLHPRIFEMLEQALSQGFKLGIVTNGTPLTPERCERLGKLGLSYIQFSFAGWDKDSYEATYVGAKFDRTLANLKSMALATANTGTNFFVKAVCTGADWENVRDRTRAFLESQGVAPHHVVTVMANNFGGNVVHGRQSPRHGVWTLKSIENHRLMPCRVLLKAVGIFCDGTVTACACYDSNAELKIGNIMDSDLGDIRKGQAFQNLVRAFESGDVRHIPMCGKCDDPFG